MDVILREKREALKLLRGQKKQLVQELRDKRKAKTAIDGEMEKLRLEIKHIKGDAHDL